MKNEKIWHLNLAKVAQRFREPKKFNQSSSDAAIFVVEPLRPLSYQCEVDLSLELVNDLRMVWIQGNRSEAARQVKSNVANTSKWTFSRQR